MQKIPYASVSKAKQAECWFSPTCSIRDGSRHLTERTSPWSGSSMPCVVQWFRQGNMKFSIVIPNYNGAHLIRKNLPAVLRAAGEHEVIVVDDASTDESVDYFRN